MPGESLELPFQKPQEETITLAHKGLYTISLRKLTTAAPFGMGVGVDFLRPSVFKFQGVTAVTGGVTLQATRPKLRKMEFVGASDTAGELCATCVRTVFQMYLCDKCTCVTSVPVCQLWTSAAPISVSGICSSHDHNLLCLLPV